MKTTIEKFTLYGPKGNDYHFPELDQAINFLALHFCSSFPEVVNVREYGNRIFVPINGRTFFILRNSNK